MSSNKILIKQLNQLINNELPNIKVTSNDSDITKLDVSFYYTKSSPDDMYPYFFPKHHSGEILINGQVDLTNFPNKPPKLTLYGDLAHCHVHPHSDHYVICFSLDESYEWFFGSKHMQSSKFNPSVSIRYYLTAVYKFLAEDDREYEVGDDRRTKSIGSWANRQIIKPTTMIPYYEALQLMNNDNNNKHDIVEQKMEIVNMYGIATNIPDNIVTLRDFVDKELLLFQNEPSLYCINYTRIGERHIYKVVSLDLLKESTFNGGVTKTSLGADFNKCFPLVIHSKIWDKTKPIKMLDKLVNQAFSKVKTNQIIKLNDKLHIVDHYLYIISELFNELAVDVFAESMFPCEEVLKGFVYLHHLLLILARDYPEIDNKSEKILDYFEANIKNRDKKVCGNIGILMTQYLTSKKNRNINCLVDELLTRNVLWSLKKPNECNDCVGYDSRTQSFYITDMERWIDVTWNNSYIGMQRFAFQQLYNNKFNKETLNSMDERFGQVDQCEIELFQREVKKLCTWKNLNGREGYKTFLDYFNLNDDNLGDRLRNAMLNSTKAGYHAFVVSKEWKYALRSITDAVVKIK